MKGQKTKERSNLKKHQDYVHTRLDSFCAGIVWTVQPRGAQVLHTHWTSCRHGWPRGLGALNSSPHSWIFTSVSVGSSCHSYLFTSMTGRKGVHNTPNYGRKSIQYVFQLLHFRDQQGAALLRDRNCATTSILVSEQKPHPVCFSWQRKNYSEEYEHSLKHSMFFIWPSITYLVMGWIWVANSILGSWWTNLYSVLPILGICTSSPISVAPKS